MRRFFYQNEAISHTAGVSMIVNRWFLNRAIFQSGSLAWPSRSPDLTAGDFFL